MFEESLETTMLQISILLMVFFLTTAYSKQMHLRKTTIMHVHMTVTGTTQIFRETLTSNSWVPYLIPTTKRLIRRSTILIWRVLR